MFMLALMLVFMPVLVLMPMLLLVPIRRIAFVAANVRVDKSPKSGW